MVRRSRRASGSRRTRRRSRHSMKSRRVRRMRHTRGRGRAMKRGGMLGHENQGRMEANAEEMRVPTEMEIYNDKMRKIFHGQSGEYKVMPTVSRPDVKYWSHDSTWKNYDVWWNTEGKKLFESGVR